MASVRVGTKLKDKTNELVQFAPKGVAQHDIVFEENIDSFQKNNSVAENNGTKENYITTTSLNETVSQLGYRGSFIKRIKSLRSKVREERNEVYFDGLIDDIMDYYLDSEGKLDTIDPKLLFSGYANCGTFKGSSRILSKDEQTEIPILSPNISSANNFSFDIVSSTSLQDVEINTDSLKQPSGNLSHTVSPTHTLKRLYNSLKRVQDRWHGYWELEATQLHRNQPQANHSNVSRFQDIHWNQKLQDNTKTNDLDHKSYYSFDHFSSMFNGLSIRKYATEPRVENSVIKLRRSYNEINQLYDNDIVYIRNNNETDEEKITNQEPPSIYTRIKSIRLKKSFLGKWI